MAGVIDPNDAMDELIQAKGLEVTTGSIQVIIALASVTTVVTINTSVKPPAIQPPNLGEKTFKDVGLDDDGVAVFKENLKVLLDFIPGEIDKLPDNSNVKISKVMEFIRLSILAAP
jgi:hypothetical protein